MAVESRQSGFRAVVAEDHQPLRSLLVEQLLELGHSVVGEASDGLAVVDLVAREHPDVALIDVGLPIQDGLAASRAIAQRAPTAVLLLSGYSSSEDPEHEARLASAHAYLAKPFLLDELDQALQQAVRRFRQATGRG